MPFDSVTSRLAAACALALIAVVATAAPAVAKGKPSAKGNSPDKATARAKLRAVAGRKVIAEKTLETGTTSVKTSPGATCFGPGTGGSGKAVKTQGPNALGLLADAAKSTAALRPLLVTDAFGFGLGLCGIGGHVAGGKGFWYLKVNHRNPELGGEAVRLASGDEVLWFLSPNYEVTPLELRLRAPRRVRRGARFRVRVLGFDDKGKRSPVAGAKVRGAKRRTGKDGRTTLALRKPRRLIARRGKDIPSNRKPVCVGRKCPRG
jgi:hypothetical protein